jgi:hypothetical protein
MQRRAVLSWKLHGDGHTLAPGDVVAPDERLSWGKTTGLGAQHVVAMFVFPLLMGLNGGALSDGVTHCVGTGGAADPTRCRIAALYPTG